MTLRPTKLFIFLYCAVVFLLLFYSFTQIDLGFNLPNIPLWVTIQKAMQQVGFFNRPLSTLLYLSILVLLFVYYAFFLIVAKKKLLDTKTFWIVLLITTVFLTASYNAFSYDLFNYIFDAKILSYYNLNPYAYRALDFPNDPMLGFMHWTHRTYPYGPVWLLLTAPLYYLGFSNFLPTQILFKLLIAGSFLGSVYYVGEIMKKINPSRALFAMVFFGLNPLILIECLVSSHNDIVMLFFAIVSIYFLLENKKTFSLLFLLLSIGTKFATAFLLPVYFYHWYKKRLKNDLPWETFFLYALLLMLLAMVIVSLRTNFQPWYLLYVLAFAPFLSQRYYVFIPSFILSVTALLNYVPFLYMGNWDEPIPTILLTLNISSVLLAVVVCLVYKSLAVKKLKHSV